MVRTTVAALLLAASVSASAATPDPDAIARLIEERYPGTKIEDARPGPLPGWIELFLGDSIAYADASGDHLMIGSLLDTRSKRNLTNDSITARRSIDFETLPFSDAIVIRKGNGSRRLAIFSDPDCPFCEQLEKELESVTDVTIYTFLYPLEDLHPGAALKAGAIWCAADRAAAWRTWMLERRMPAAASTCAKAPIDSNVALGKTLKITGTPTLYLENGQRVDGTLHSAELEQRLSEAAAR